MTFCYYKECKLSCKLAGTAVKIAITSYQTVMLIRHANSQNQQARSKTSKKEHERENKQKGVNRWGADGRQGAITRATVALILARYTQDTVVHSGLIMPRKLRKIWPYINWNIENKSMKHYKLSWNRAKDEIIKRNKMMQFSDCYFCAKAAAVQAQRCRECARSFLD